MADDRHVRRSGDDYADALLALLPDGIGWQGTAGSVLAKTVRGIAGIWGLIDGRIADLLERESDPRTTIELLPEWERAFGLPDPCMTEVLSVAGRRNILVQRMTTLGAQNRGFFIDRAAELGYTIRIVERLPFQFGISWVGETRWPTVNGGWPTWEIGPPELRYSWFIQVTNTGLFWWRFGEAEIGIDPHLRFSFATDVECIIKRWKPAHTVLIFDYSHVIAGPDTQNILFATDKGDQAAFVAAAFPYGPLAAVDAPDRAVLAGLGISASGSLAVTEAKDILNAAVTGITGLFAFTDRTDTGAFLGASGIDNLSDEVNGTLLDENGQPIYTTG